jgi:hypothetical protein
MIKSIWRKSTYSGTGNTCVEVTRVDQDKEE